MSKNVLDLNQTQLDDLKKDMKEGKYTLKEIAQKHGVEYSSFMYWMQRNRVSYDLKLSNGTRITSGEEREEDQVKEERPSITDEVRENIVKDMIIGDKVSTIANRYSVTTQDVMYELQNNCVQADFEVIRNSIDISKRDSIRFGTIAYIIANPKKKRNDFRKESRYNYNKVIESIYFLITLGILQKSDYIPLKIPNLFKTKFDQSEQEMFIEAVQNNMDVYELANMFNIESYEVEKILQSEEFNTSLEIYKLKHNTSAETPKKEEKHEEPKKSISEARIVNSNNTIKELETQLTIKNLDIEKLKLQIDLNKIKEQIRDLEIQERDIKNKIAEIDEQINSMK